MKTSKLLITSALAAAASVAVGGGAQTVENTHSMQAAPAIQVAQAQGKSTKAKKTGKKKAKAGACSGLRVGEKFTIEKNGALGIFRIEKIFPAAGEAAVRCVTVNGQSCSHVPTERIPC